MRSNLESHGTEQQHRVTLSLSLSLTVLLQQGCVVEVVNTVIKVCLLVQQLQFVSALRSSTCRGVVVSVLCVVVRHAPAAWLRCCLCALPLTGVANVCKGEYPARTAAQEPVKNSIALWMRAPHNLLRTIHSFLYSDTRRRLRCQDEPIAQ
jgi:hypothetical protein